MSAHQAQDEPSKPPAPSPTRLLIVGPSWVGDMIMAQSLFIVLKKQYPNLLIDVLAPKWSNALIERMPEINQAIDMPLGHGQLGISERYRLGKSLEGQYDWSILLPNSLKSALVPFFAGIQKRSGYTGEMRYGLLNERFNLDKKQLTRTVQRFVALAFHKEQIYQKQYTGMQAIPNPKLKINKESAWDLAFNKFALLASDAKKEQQQILALCPGAEYGPAKQWPSEHYAALAKRFIEEHQDQASIWLFGSDKDFDFCSKIEAQLGNLPVKNLAGKTSLAEAIDLLALAQSVVSNDSGLMHVAAAVGAKVVGVYGSSDPNFTPPLSETAEAISLGLNCSPCFKRECPLKHLNCLKQLTPNLVWEKLQALSSNTLSTNASTELQDSEVQP